MSRGTFTVSELAALCTGGNIALAARLLNDAGAQPLLDEFGRDRAHLAAIGSRVINRAVVIKLQKTLEATMAGRRLATLLAEG